MRLVSVLSALLLCPAFAVVAQRQQQPEIRRGAAAFTFETVGGVGGSLLGVGGGLLIANAANDCESEDLACNLEQAATTGLVSVIGATAGTYSVTQGIVAALGSRLVAAVR